MSDLTAKTIQELREELVATPGFQWASALEEVLRRAEDLEPVDHVQGILVGVRQTTGGAARAEIDTSPRSLRLLGAKIGRLVWLFAEGDEDGS